MHGHVKDGTGAGWRRVREPEPWACACVITEPGPERGLENIVERRVQPGHRYSCPDCGARRPAS